MKRLLLLPALLLAGCAAPEQTTISLPVVAAGETIPSPGEATDLETDTAPFTSIARPEGVPNGQTRAYGLTLPAGFQISVFAQGLDHPRRIAVVPNAKNKTGYDVAVSQSYQNNVVLLRDANGDGKADSQTTLLSGLNQPYGLEFGSGFLYVANTDAVWRYPFTAGQTRVTSVGKKIAELTKGGYNNHWTRNLLFDQGRRNLFVTVGSSCNTCEESDPQRAGISTMTSEGANKRIMASGLRNPTGIAWNPVTRKLWTVVNERDLLGDDTPPDYLTQVVNSRFYGWPYAYTDIKGKVIPDPNFGAKSPQKVAATIRADVPLQAHSAALGLAFYPLTGNQFPATFQGDAFLAFHGSWNRSKKTGYKIVRVDFKDGKPVLVSNFVTGFLKADGSNWGRPVDIQNAPDGSLLFSDDQGGKIWRIFYKGQWPECGQLIARAARCFLEIGKLASMKDRDLIARAILVKDGALLVNGNTNKKTGESYVALPGGHVDPGESCIQALKREIEEELAATCEVGELVFVTEDIYAGREQDEKSRHELTLFFAATIAGEKTRADGTIESPEKWKNFHWLPIAKLAEANLLPRAAKKRLMDEGSPVYQFTDSR